MNTGEPAASGRRRAAPPAGGDGVAGRRAEERSERGGGPLLSTAIRVRPRAAAALVVTGAFGVAAVGWPLLVSPGAALGQSAAAPWLFAALLPLVLVVVLAEVAEGGLDAKAVAILGVLS